MINGNGPAYVAGGPSGFADIKPNSALCNNDVRITAPPRSASFVLVEKSSVTGVVDIDPADKIIKILPNPSLNGNFLIRFNGFVPTGPVAITIINEAGQLLFQQQINPAQTLSINRHLQQGVYFIKIEMQKGVTVKKVEVKGR